MPREIPHSLEGSLPSQNGDISAADALRVHGGTGLPGEDTMDRMSVPDSTPEVGSESWQEIVEHTWDAVDTLTGSIPDLAEFRQAGIDFAGLEAGYKAYEDAEYMPELVIFPVNYPLDSWKKLYRDLAENQASQFPATEYKLRRDGLFVVDDVEDNWLDLEQQAVTSRFGNTVIGPNNVVWKALVVPIASSEDGDLAVNTSWNLNTQSFAFRAQMQALGMTEVSRGEAHMPIGAYLTLQAVRLLRNAPPIDAVAGITWNAGAYPTEDQQDLLAPNAFWNGPPGFVQIDSDLTTEVGAYTGVRLPVWG